MRRLDPEQARAAKAALAEKLTAIAASHLPDGYTVEYHKSLTGWCDLIHKVIRSPRPITRKSYELHPADTGWIIGAKDLDYVARFLKAKAIVDAFAAQPRIDLTKSA